MNILDALRNAIDFSRRDIVDIVKNRSEINEAVKGIDSVVENDYRYSRMEKNREYAGKRNNLLSSIKNHSAAIKTAVKGSEDRQYTEVENLAVEFMKTFQAESDRKFEAWSQSTGNFKTASSNYHTAINDEVDHDWGHARIFARIDDALANKNTVPNFQPPQYVEAKKELNVALNEREGRILTAVAKTTEVEQAFTKIVTEIQTIKIQTAQNVSTVSGKQLTKALDAKYIELQQQINDIAIKNAKLNNITYIQNTAKNNLTKGEYKKLHDEAREFKQNKDAAGYAERVAMIKMLDEKFITHPAIKELAVEMKNLENQFNASITKNNTVSKSIQDTMTEIKSEKNKLKTLDDVMFQVESKNLSIIMKSEDYKKQLKEAQNIKSKSSSMSM